MASQEHRLKAWNDTWIRFEPLAVKSKFCEVGSFRLGVTFFET